MKIFLIEFNFPKRSLSGEDCLEERRGRIIVGVVGGVVGLVVGVVEFVVAVLGIGDVGVGR